MISRFTYSKSLVIHITMPAMKDIQIVGKCHQHSVYLADLATAKLKNQIFSVEIHYIGITSLGTKFGH